MVPSYVRFGNKQRFFSGKKVFRKKKVWGEEQWIVNKEYCGKKLVLRKNHRCSIHLHKKKDEVFYLQSGKVLLEIDGQSEIMVPGDFVHIPAGSPHRFTGLEDSEIMEFSTTHEEDDSFRLALSGHIEQERYDRQRSIIDHFSEAAVLVVGDVMLDTYVHGTVSRISPEAPVPVVHHEREQSLPGGAANTAMNLATLGAKVTLLSVTGDDRESRILKKMMEKEQIRSGFLPDASRFTTQKTRIVSHGWHQIVRLDHEVAHPLASSLEKKLLTKISALLPKHQALLLSDYGKGVLTPPVLQGCIRMAQRLRIPVVLDPKPRDAGYARYVRGVTVMTPNSREAQIMCQSSARDPKTLAKKLSGMTQSNVLVTLGADGMCLYERSGTSQLLPALTSDVADVSGAGDTVSAMIALTLATQGSLRDGVDLSNRAASIVVRKQGTAVLSREELLRTL